MSVTFGQAHYYGSKVQKCPLALPQRSNRLTPATCHTTCSFTLLTAHLPTSTIRHTTCSFPPLAAYLLTSSTCRTLAHLLHPCLTLTHIYPPNALFLVKLATAIIPSQSLPAMASLLPKAQPPQHIAHPVGIGYDATRENFWEQLPSLRQNKSGGGRWLWTLS